MQHLLRNRKRFVVIFLVLAGIGFADASFLTVQHYTGAGVPCTIVEGCETVLTSEYSAIGPIPIALIGAAYYLTLLALMVAYADTGRIALFRAATAIPFLGLLASAYLVVLQVFVIEAICLYCMVSAAISTILAGMGLWARKNT